MDAKSVPNFRGRFEFLEATEKHWTEPLASLLSFTVRLPEFGVATPATISELTTVPGCEEAAAAIRSWAKQYDIRDTWMLDAAVQTLCAKAAREKSWLELLESLPDFGIAIPKFASYPELIADPASQKQRTEIRRWAATDEVRDQRSRDTAVETAFARVIENEAGWAYVAPELDIRVFSLEIGAWVPREVSPHGQTWGEFQRGAVKTFLRQLEEYGKRARRIWGARRPALRLHAEWTALWQKGRSPEQIRIWNQRNHNRNVSLPNIQTCVHEFASAIGLTLRVGKTTRKK
jgi:hypothetical protein